jgi:hypothetical protein
MNVKTVILTSLISMNAASTVAAQNANCAARAVVLETLAGKYGENRRSIGLAPQGQVVEVFASAQTGTWTITVTRPDGLTCMIASGQSYETLDEPLRPTGTKS